MESNSKLKISLEIIWLIITGLICLTILYPILSKVQYYPFTVPNILFIFIFITATRYIFFLKHTFLAKKNVLKLILIFACIPLIAYLINTVNLFQTYLDNLDDVTWKEMFGLLERTKQKQIHQYIRTEMLLFGTGAIITTFLFAIRMVVSIWRQKNKGTV